MKHLVFTFDVISPYAWLAFERLPQVLEGCSYSVNYRPVVFGALLKHHAHKGPAEIEPKRQWTFRHVSWLAHQQGTVLQTPAQHPFNSLALQRLIVAAGPNRRTVEAVFRHVWAGGGADANDPARLAALRDTLTPARGPDSEEVKAELRAHTEAAITEGVFGVPTVSCEGRHFWGLDALPMLRDALSGGTWFQGGGWDDEGAPRPGLKRS